MVAQPTGQLGLALLLGLKAVSHRDEIPVLLQVQLPDIRLLRGGRWGGERGEGRGEGEGESFVFIYVFMYMYVCMYLA